MEPEYLDCSVPEPEIKNLDNWVYLSDFVNDLKDTNVLIVSNIDKFILNTDDKLKIGWYNIENGTPHNLNTALTGIDYLIIHCDYFDHFDEIKTQHLRLMKFKENYKTYILDRVERVMEYNGD